MILSGHSIRDYYVSGQSLITPFVERTKQRGMSYGLSMAGYDVRADILNCDRELVSVPDSIQFADNEEEDYYQMGIWLERGEFLLASTVEEFHMPNDIIAFVKDKSTWARQGLAVQNTVIEPGWKGFLTMELTNHGPKAIWISDRDPIAQIVFQKTDVPCTPYDGKYQNQEMGPQGARFDGSQD